MLLVSIMWWFPVSEGDTLGVLVHRIYFWPYMYCESGCNVGWMSMSTVLCGGPPSFHRISLVLRITMLLSGFWFLYYSHFKYRVCSNLKGNSGAKGLNSSRLSVRLSLSLSLSAWNNSFHRTDVHVI